MPNSKYLFTLKEFEDAVVKGRDCPKPSEDKYLALASQCETSGDMHNKKHVAMFLAQIIWESDCLQAKEEYACLPPKGCPNAYPVTKDIGIAGKDYHGRGYIQLTWDYNYKACSQDLYKNNTLIDNPEIVSTSENVAWATALWYWKSRVAVNANVQKFWFGASTQAINGALECTGWNEKARKRFDIYKKVLLAFNVSDEPIENGCYN